MDEIMAFDLDEQPAVVADGLPMICTDCGGDYAAPLRLFVGMGIDLSGTPEGRNADGTFTCWRCRARA